MYINEGIIVLLDALGARNLTIDDCRKYLKFIEQTRKSAKKLSSKEIRMPDIRTFGDSVLLSWEIRKKDDPCLVFDEAIITTITFLALGYEQNFPLRGAMSHGSFERRNSAILGPAVNDAAQWHDRAEWVGCLTTPSLNYWLEHLCLLSSEQQKQVHYKFLYKYDVPIKDSKHLRTWAIFWGEFLSPIAEKLDDLTASIRKFSAYTAKLQIPIGTEQKYINTKQFFVHCCRNRLKHFSSESVLPSELEAH